jgi:ribosome-associated protein
MPETSKRIEAEGEPERREESATETGARPAPALKDEPLDERIASALHAAADKKAADPVVLDLREVASFTDFFVVVSGTNARQVQAVADGVTERLKKEHGQRPARVEGYNTAEWVLLDYGDFIFHVFEEKSRRFYDLERLWRDAARVALPPGLAGPEGSLRSGR